MKILITGGAGFIGSHAAKHFLAAGNKVVVFDNLSRIGSADNLSRLRDTHPDVVFEKGDVRNSEEVESVFDKYKGFDAVIHLAAQVAVTTSVVDPRNDFGVNAMGTVNVLEACRRVCPDAAFIYSSTNKVYGELDYIELTESATRYELPETSKKGISEAYNLDFHSPYGCSKGAADQYVHDYARIYDMKTVVFRQSCIYGTEQFGVEDQGWVAWFAIAKLLKLPLTVYGDGKQVRDLLWIDDLIQLYQRAIDKREALSGKCYNVGGGPSNAASVLEVMDLLDGLIGVSAGHATSDWRAGDQKLFICDTTSAFDDFGWRPTTSIKEGCTKLVDWVKKSKQLIADLNAARFAHSSAAATK